MTPAPLPRVPVLRAALKQQVWTTGEKIGRDSPHRGYGEVTLAQEGDWRMIVRKDKVEI